MPAPAPLLIIVHPGSACGSADMNLGREAAEVQRLDMQLLIEQWDGGVIVIDGELSDELEGFRRDWQDLGQTITDALEQAQSAGLLSERIMGDDNSDYTQMAAARDLVAKHGLTPENTSITLTGAWIDDDGDGCVHSVRQVLEGFGFQPTIEDAMNLDFELDDNEDKIGERMDNDEVPEPTSTRAAWARRP